MLFHLHAVDRGHGREVLFEVCDCVDGEGGLEVGEDEVLFCERCEGFGCLRRKEIQNSLLDWMGKGRRGGHGYVTIVVKDIRSLRLAQEWELEMQYHGYGYGEKTPRIST